MIPAIVTVTPDRTSLPVRLTVITDPLPAIAPLYTLFDLIVVDNRYGFISKLVKWFTSKITEHVAVLQLITNPPLNTLVVFPVTAMSPVEVLPERDERYGRLYIVKLAFFPENDPVPSRLIYPGVIESPFHIFCKKFMVVLSVKSIPVPKVIFPDPNNSK